MKLFVAAALLLALSPSTARGENLRSSASNSETTSNRGLLNPSDAICKGTTLMAGDSLAAGESICQEIDDEMVYFGVRSYENPSGWPDGYTQHLVEVWSENGTHQQGFYPIYKAGDAPNLRLDVVTNNLVFGESPSGHEFSFACLAKPDNRGPAAELKVEGPLPDLVKLRDNEGVLSWTLLKSPGDNIFGSDCYPDTPSKCVGKLTEKNRLSWDEWVCDFDSEGNVVTKFGLGGSGRIELWHNGLLKWYSAVFTANDIQFIQGDYLHLQGDAHLTLYSDTDPIEYKWVSRCHWGEDTKIVVKDGDVTQFNKDGTAHWSLLGSQQGVITQNGFEIEPVCHATCEL